jgi:AcrR family transcriptional regulator
MVLPSTRERILDAAAHVMSTRGLAATTTKEIARAAGFSEAALYKHFRDKEELFLCVLSTRLPPLIALLEELPGRAGQGSVAANLEEVARAAVAFYDRSVPMAASLFADPELLARHRERLEESGAGPQRPFEVLTAYLRAEQRLGRLSRTAKPTAAAALLLGSCFQRAFFRSFLGESAAGAADAVFAREAVRTLLRSLSPEQPPA